MAKIKLNVKNTQIAEALNKASLSKKKPKEAAKPPLKEIPPSVLKEEDAEEIVSKKKKPVSSKEEASSLEEVKEKKAKKSTRKKETVLETPSEEISPPSLPPVPAPLMIKKTKEAETLPLSEEKKKEELPSSLPVAEKEKKPHAELLDDSLLEKKTSSFKDFKNFRKPEKQAPAFDARSRHGLRAPDEDQRWRKLRPLKSLRKESSPEAIIRPTSLKIKLPVSLKDLAAEMKLKASQLISKLFSQGIALTLNDLLDDPTVVQLLGHDFGCEITIDTSEKDRLRITDKTIKEEILSTDPSDLLPRPPVVTFMGHVDHGKTSLIDWIRKSHVANQEAGAITQHIGAFSTPTTHGLITILDTPGHEAFSEMRSRGAMVTDIVVLVIAGDEGIRMQTEEAIRQAKEANVPIVVALNKNDKPGFDAEKVYRQLADQDLLPEAWGGKTITVSCSAVTGQGIPELLEMLALQADILELRANPTTRARGTVLESEMHKGLGVTATVLVQNGTLRIGDALVFGEQWGRVKTMTDQHHAVQEVSPSFAVKITGLSDLAKAGSEFIVVKTEKEAKELALARREGQKRQTLLISKKDSLESFLQQKDAPVKKILHLILRADVQGSLEALKNSLAKIQSDKVSVLVVNAEVGEISESDIQLAAAAKAYIIGFHTSIESHAESLIKQYKVEVRLHDIIYHAIDDVKRLMATLLDKIPKETDMGEAEVKTVFKSSHLGNIAGCFVTDGIIKRNQFVRILRNNEIIWKGKIASLKRLKEDVKEVLKGLECGILVESFSDFKEGDILQTYEITYLEQKI